MLRNTEGPKLAAYILQATHWTHNGKQPHLNNHLGNLCISLSLSPDSFLLFGSTVSLGVFTVTF